MEKQHKYFQNSILSTRSIILGAYNKLPIKAPKFIENTIYSVDKLTEPYVKKAAILVDVRVNNVVKVLEPIKQRADELREQGRNFGAHVKAGSATLINTTVDLALHNKASQVVITSADSLTDRLLSTIESRVTYLAELSRKKGVHEVSHQKGSLKNYHDRVLVLAHDVADLSNHLYGLLKQQAKQRTQQIVFVEQARAIVRDHYRATVVTIRVIVYTPILEHFAQNKQAFIAHLEELKSKYTNHQLRSYLMEQFQQGREYLTAEQMKSLIQTAHEYLSIENAQTQYQMLSITYKRQLRQMKHDGQQEEEERSQEESKQNENQIEMSSEIEQSHEDV